ncbi:hypothetical protein [uncultured Duncaniella sp.]|uniref:hypothetical protein n=1 Tax=uncultured Duncaniella sp. TaxID=2768039 RepID=UPI0025D44BE3|nr:hypothetical protein [uncultured Duncaniella sp.]
MKKLFTLFAAAAMTMSVSAEEYLVAYNVEGQENHGYAISGTTDDDREVTLENGTKIVALSFNNNWGEANDNYIKLTADGGFKTGDVVTVKGVIANKDEAKRGACKLTTSVNDLLYKSDDFVNLTLAPTSDVPSYTYTLAADAPELYLSRDGNTRTQLIYISVVRAEGGETPEEPSGETRTMTLSGSWPQGEFGSIETPFEMDFDTMTLTLKNFLGAKGDAVCKVEQRDPNAVPTVGTMFNIIPEAGFTETGDLYGDKTYSIDGLSSSVIFTADGVNTVKLDNPNVIFTNYSSVELATGKQYNFVIYLFGNYSQWDSAANAWGEVSSMPGYFDLKTTVSGDETSAIENIEVEAADENAPVEYFNIQGMRVENPAAGQLLIRRQGSKVSKVIIR